MYLCVYTHTLKHTHIHTHSGKTVQSVLRGLSVFAHQIVVFDDASKDNTRELVEQVAGEYRVSTILGIYIYIVYCMLCKLMQLVGYIYIYIYI